MLRWYIEKGFFNFESLKKINQWLLHDYKQFIRNKNKGI
ncbi:HNH endonuclease [Bacillus phage BUCT083]|nr:HNH endonuclease [Bacillus phage BUCT083]